MLDKPQFLADRLLQEGGRVVNFFNQLHSEQWGIIVYSEESAWNFHDLLAHFVSAEIGRRELIANVSAGGTGAPLDFDIDQFNHAEVERYSRRQNDELIDAFTRERSALVAEVLKLSAEDLNKVGNDPFLGMVTVSEMVKLTYRHLQIHLRETRRLLE